MRKLALILLVVGVLFALAISPIAAQNSGPLVIESWRNDDLSIWQDTIIPAFNASHPDIQVVFSPSPPADYNGLLNSRLAAGTAGDLIACRPFDASLALYQQGYLASLNDLPGMDSFSSVAKSAWITDDGSNVFCVPMASVIHGFFYNADAFAQLGLSEPTTVDEFYSVLDAIKADGTYAPLVMGTADQWESATMGYENIGSNYWQGEAGRLGLINGTEKFNQGGFLAAFQALARWQPYLINGYQALSYPDAQSAFTLGLGAIYPTGSWEISGFEANAGFHLGIFPPPVAHAGDTCYISDHTDIAMGMNAALTGDRRTQAETFLSWVASSEFAQLYANALPGFFPLSSGAVTLNDPLAQEFLSWRSQCQSTIRASYQILSRGTPNLENELWRVNAQMLNGDITPQQAADQIQQGLDSWYTPMGMPTPEATAASS